MSEILYSSLKTRQMFHLLTQNMITTFKFGGRAIFSSKFEFEKFLSLFYIILFQLYSVKRVLNIKYLTEQDSILT